MILGIAYGMGVELVRKQKASSFGPKIEQMITKPTLN